ncbi:hypothetical protein ABIC16_001800 [Sphingomonas sp. PvP055]|uniref:DUF6975 family protein n=1 Tax=Sphingomonas sp. PvP055 TaxID=3156391 RepID=UPI003399AFDC
MPSRSPNTPRRDLEPSGFAVLAAADGSASHPLLAQLSDVAAWGRDIADAIHCICAVHGGTTGNFRAAALHPVPGVAQHWMEDAAIAFAGERAYLAAVTAAVGPLPSTPGQAASDSAFAALRHAFNMLATSDRVGCSAGAAIALLTDWTSFRQIFDTAADRLGVEIPVNALPDTTAVIAAYAAPEVPAAAQRAIRFGAQQAFAQHRGLLDLLEARAAARDHA